MPKYALDTNVYIDTRAGAPSGFALKQFLSGHFGRTFLSAVVIQELRARARTPSQVDALNEGIIAPFERRDRLFAPSVQAFRECGRVIAALITEEGLAYADTKRSLVNDVLIAVSCRERGITLITSDGDFKMIAKYVSGLTWESPFPA